MIRERQLNTIAFVSGGLTLTDIPKDAVFHWLTLSCFGGTFATVQGAMGTGPALVPTFPFVLMRNVRVIRNGSDVVYQGSGEQLAKEHYYLNNQHPFARLYTTTANVETLRTASVRGITVMPANGAAIGECTGSFTVPDAPAGTGTLSFDFQVDLWFQMGADDAYYGTLVDARELATFQLEILWNTEAACIATAGTANTSSTASFNVNLLSIDQDNLDVGSPFGTFKRSAMSISNIQYNSSNNQILLPRGNFWQGIILRTRAFKAGSTVNPIEENAVLTTINNRINSNFSLRQDDFRQLQARNQADNTGRPYPWQSAQGSPQGWALLSFINATVKAADMPPSYDMDQFDLQVSTFAIGSSQNGVTTAATLPTIDLLFQEVIPGVSSDKAAPRGAVNGSTRRTSARPGMR